MYLLRQMTRVGGAFVSGEGLLLCLLLLEEPSAVALTSGPILGS